MEYEVEAQRVLSLLDTGARVPAQRVAGIFPADLAETLGYDPQTEGVPTVLDTRLGKYQGYLLRIPIFIPATEGDGLDVELTWIVVPGWPGPPVMGWGGCLERLRFALDPSQGEECVARRKV